MNENFKAKSSARTMVIAPFLKNVRHSSDSKFKLRDPKARLEEAIGLTEAIDVDVIVSEVISVTQPRAATLLGKGAIENLHQIVEAEEISLTVFDTHLTPIQQRNLEGELNCKVIDRTALILEIFGARARTREGTLQVELAHLSYQRSRLVRSWTHLERQRGGFGFIGGPGETQIELDRRLISERIAKLKNELDDVKRTRTLHRAARKRVPFPIVALVGYTNAGKSTLFNHMTKANVFSEDMLFATLDPTMRRVELPTGREIILSDTVGFISDLPTELIAAFRATLEEVLEADLIIHVRDVSHSDTEAQKNDVLKVLSDLGIDDNIAKDGLEVANKLDLLEDEVAAYWHSRSQKPDGPIVISALHGDGIDALLDRIDQSLSAKHRHVDINLSHAEGRLLSWLYEHGQVTDREDSDEGISIRVLLSPEDLARFDVLNGEGGVADD